MYRMLFEPEIMAEHYNCSGRTFEEWKALGSPNLALGWLYAILGAIFWITYLPFLVVFIKSDLLKHSCYKIMFFLGIVDVVQIPVGGFICGYFSAIGMVYCMYPVLDWIGGSLALSLWTAGSTTCMILALNRFFDILSPRLAAKLFGGRKTYLWLAIPTCYCFCIFFFYPPTVFTSKMYAFFFDPFVGMPERHGSVDSEHYPFAWLSVHNVCVTLWLFCAYAGICILLSVKSRGLSSRVLMSRIQRQTFATAALICAGTFVAALVYCFMQFLSVPLWVVVVGQVGWQCSHGMVGFTYLCMNATMRREAYRIFWKRTCSKGSTVSAAHTHTPHTESDLENWVY